MAAQTDQGTIRVVVVDDHPLLLEATRRCLEAAGGIAVVGESAQGRPALDLVAEERPDVLLLDLHLPDVSGVEIAQEVHASSPDVAVLILTGHDEVGYFRRLLKLGVAGYLPKTASGDELVAAVRSVSHGRTVLVSEAATGALAAVAETLTRREQDVLGHLADGLSNAEIARALWVSEKTVEFHVSHVFQKLGVHSRVQAVVRARECGLVMPRT